MTDPAVAALARRLVDIERRMRAQERAARLTFSTVGVATSDDDSASVVDLDVSGALWSGVEASVDAQAAQETAALAARTFTQPEPPRPSEQPDGKIPEGSLWTDTDADNRQYRWEGEPTDGVWVQQPIGQGALDQQLLALVLGRFSTLADRDSLLPNPGEGQQAYVVETNLDYQFSSGQWVPQLQFVRKNASQSNSSGITWVTDATLRATLVPGWYRIEAVLHLRGNADGDFHLRWQYGGTVATGDSRHCLGPASESTTGASTLMRSTGATYSDAIRYGVVDATSDIAVREELLFRVTSTGELTLQFKQADAGATNGQVTMGAQSRLYITKVN